MPTINVTPIDGIVRPEWFQSSSDATNIQNAIDLAAATGAKVVLLPKKYKIGSVTLKFYTSSVIEGTICGAYDRSAHTGTTIAYQGTGVAMQCECLDTARDTCFRFRLSDFALCYWSDPDDYRSYDVYSTSAVGLAFLSQESGTAPRNGDVTNLRIRNFATGIRINALSYVNFTNISIYNFSCGIKLEKTTSNRYLEFARFDKIMLGTSVPSATGILLRDGNVIYFNHVDANDCRYGISMESNYSLFDVFIDKYYAVRCMTGLMINAYNSSITRTYVSDMSIHPGSSSQYGLYFKQRQSYIFDDSVFCRISDSMCVSSGYKFMHNENVNLSNCSFSDLRVLNSVYGLNNVKKFSLLKASAFGKVTIPAQTRVVDVDISKAVLNINSEVLNAILYGNFSASYSYYESNNRLYLKITADSISSSARTITYLIPKLL